MVINAVNTKQIGLRIKTYTVL